MKPLNAHPGFTLDCNLIYQELVPAGEPVFVLIRAVPPVLSQVCISPSPVFLHLALASARIPPFFLCQSLRHLRSAWTAVTAAAAGDKFPGDGPTSGNKSNSPLGNGSDFKEEAKFQYGDDSRVDKTVIPINMNYNGSFRIVQELGRGSYGTVKLIQDLDTNKRFVLKEVDLSRATMKERLAAELEAKILSTLKHPSIVQHKGSYQTPGGMLHLIMAHCDGGDLHSKIQARKCTKELFTETLVLDWFVQIVMAVQYIHERHILHRDMKTPNVFLTKSNIVKLGDFGISKILDATMDYATTMVGTPFYMSPEILMNKPYDYKSDIWGVGCCLYELCALRFPFHAKDISTLAKVVTESKPPPIATTFSTDLQKILRACLHKIPEKRPSARKILRHPFIRKHIASYLQSSFSKLTETTNMTSLKPLAKSTTNLVSGASTISPLLPSIEPCRMRERSASINNRKRRKSRLKLILQQQASKDETDDSASMKTSSTGSAASDALTNSCRSKSAPREHDTREHQEGARIASAGYMRTERRIGEDRGLPKKANLDGDLEELYEAMRRSLRLEAEDS